MAQTDGLRRGGWGCLIPLLFVLVLVTLVLVISFGSVDIPPAEVYRILLRRLSGGVFFSGDEVKAGTELIVWDIRFPRVTVTAVSGAIFALTGVFMQTLTQNPVAEPYILGVSAGASAGAVAAIIFGLSFSAGEAGVPLAAFLGAALALLLVLFLAGRRPSPLRLVLLGLGVSGFFSALTSFTLNEAQNDSQLRSAVFWMLGSFSGARWQDILPVSLALLLSLGFGLFLEKELDALLLGDSGAASLGVPVRRVKTFVAGLSAMAVALVVSCSGVVGFVGLIVPHAARSLCGPLHRKLLPVSALLGAIFMMGADALARTLFSPEEIPVGILTSLLGAPLFVWIVWRGYLFGGQS